MQVLSTRLGEVDVDPNTIITFPQALPGFENSKRFKLFHEDKDKPIVLWLQSLDEPDVTLNLIDPAVLGLDYEVVLSDEESALLQLASPSDVVVLLLISKEGEQVEPKTQSPILINTESRIGIQKMGIQARIVFRNV